MAKQDTAGQFETLRKEIEAGDFRPVYILMGEEPYYPEKLCSIIMDKALLPHERDFNQTVLYGADTTAEEIVSTCERYPMMAERTLVVVREAQALKKLEVSAYTWTTSRPLPYWFCCSQARTSTSAPPSTRRPPSHAQSSSQQKSGKRPCPGGSNPCSAA